MLSKRHFDVPFLQFMQISISYSFQHTHMWLSLSWILYCHKITPDFNINASREVTLLVLSKSDYIHSLLYSSKLNM